ncbi:hypothetical protein LTR85_003692 [Meristemomyces frigidus]|nr:hypothetical protein LTR85_003692 [Meristemomyces frigidus]
MECVQHVLLDIEGTICPISFVKETLFPYAIRALPEVLAKNWSDPTFRPYRDAFPEEFRASPETLRAHVEDLTKRDVKIAYHKNLQGYLWEEGYKTGAYSTPLFSDVAPQLRNWKDKGIQLAIYSSGSVFAQKLLFQHVEVTESVVGKKRTAAEAANGDTGEHKAQPAAKRGRTTRSQATKASESTTAKADGGGEEAAVAKPDKGVTDLTDLISGWFDTTNAGLKTEASSYSKITAALKWPPASTLFLSDNVREIDAATEAGIKAILVDRPGNAEVSGTDRARMEVILSLDEIHLSSASQLADQSTSAGAVTVDVADEGTTEEDQAALEETQPRSKA